MRRGMALVAGLALSAGCSGFIDDKAASSTLRILEKSNVAASRQADIDLAREALPGGIFQLEAFALAYPGHAKFRVLHAEALCQYGIAFVFDDWEDAQLAGNDAVADRVASRLTGLLTQCVDANRALLPAGWDKRTLTKAEVPHALWIAMAGAVQIALNPMAAMAKLPEVKGLLTQITEVWPGYHGADAEILLGTLEAAQSAFLGGADGSARFEAARKLTGGTLLNVEVMYARGVAVAKKDRALFTQTLERALAVDVTKWPEQRLSNELARRKAQRYLAAIDRLIPPP